MKKQPLISLIIPVYNAEKYLNACIDSVLKQTYSNIEVILVNDGSKDTSGDICNHYKYKDSRIKVIHIENGGVSRARNKGIEVCNGDYISFIDSDDTIDSDYIKSFYDSFIDGVEIYIQGTNIIRQDGTNDKVSYKAIGVTSIYEIFDTNKLCGHGYAHGKIYHSTLIKNNNIKFREEIKFSEDLLFILECLLFTDKIKYMDNSGYNYFLREGNASSKEYPIVTELNCIELFSLLINKLTAKYNIDIISITNVAEIYSMLFARVRNAMYNQGVINSERLRIYDTLTVVQKDLLYKHKYISNKAVQIGYSLLKFNLIKIMDTYFSIIYKLKRI